MLSSRSGWNRTILAILMSDAPHHASLREAGSGVAPNVPAHETGLGADPRLQRDHAAFFATASCRTGSSGKRSASGAAPSTRSLPSCASPSFSVCFFFSQDRFLLRHVIRDSHPNGLVTRPPRGLPARNRTWTPSFGDSDLESTRTGRDGRAHHRAAAH
jgi:hypothetical protein